MGFYLDVPRKRVISGATRFGGWYIPAHAKRVDLQLHIEGVPTFSLWHGNIRPDVRDVFPAVPGALYSGFFGGFEFLDNWKTDGKLNLKIVDCGASTAPEILHDAQYTFSRPPQPPRRHRLADLPRIIGCPACGGILDLALLEHRCQTCGTRGPVVLGVPHFHALPTLPFLRVAEAFHTHPYGSNAQAILTDPRNELILDLGAGNTPPEWMRPNVVYFDVQQYRNTDVVATTDRLPFQDAVFNAVISQAVFEHLADPHGTAREIHRVLKPGGKVYIDTAFLQPLHGDPSHYYNMTIYGLRRVMKHFEEIKTGSAPYQSPSYSLQMQIEQVLPVMAEGFWKERLGALLEDVKKRRPELDDQMGPEGRQILAAGYYFLGRKAG